MAADEQPPASDGRTRLSRRGVLASLAGAGAAGIAGAAAGAELRGGQPGGAARPGEDQPGYGAVPPFGGPHQAGIATPRPASLVLATFDATAADRPELAGLLREWTRVISELAAGEPGGHADSGETRGLPASRLTITVGFGPSLFDERFGLARELPLSLRPLPEFPRDRIDRSLTGGDLVVQACAEGEVTAAHAVRQLARVGAGVARPRWLTAGFAPAPELLGRATPRNQLGFKDGTANAAPGSRAFGATVWVPAVSGPAWLAGGTFLCYRKIRIALPSWDALSIADQQAVIGRVKSTGAPLSGGTEHSPLRLAARTADGSLTIPPDSHVRLAAPQLSDGAQLYRRSFAYEDGIDQSTGHPDAGQLFLAFAASPEQQFVPILARLAASDRLNQFTTHVASGIWALPPAPPRGGFLGDALLA
jgi:deferrochelatase/peroxidase EfeB